MTEITDLKKLPEYQEKSIISRILLKNPGGNITCFAFGKGESLSEHTTPYNAFILILDGKAEIKIADKYYQLEEHETIILPANIPHAVTALSNFKMLLVMIKQETK
ncbi:MAG: cupin domain-containing protein [Balneolaceae bacterium]|jgi:quercetin dioxygenase-like cupin family protein|nr:MAG: cupin domain-containing protein [Balneolaceae bacterium]